MDMSEYDMYLTSIDEVENRTIDDTKFSVVKNYKIKNCCKIALESSELVINFLKIDINAKKEKRDT